MIPSDSLRCSPSPLRAVLAFLIAHLAIVTGHAASHLSQFGISWTFDHDYPTGQFANGDYWVVGPVRITAITPGDENPRDAIDYDGTVINPQPDTHAPYVQGWDSRLPSTTYERSLNAGRRLPLAVGAGSSVVSVRSYTDKSDERNLWLRDAAVLTVVASAPPAGSFRPPYAGTDKAIPGNADNLDVSFLRDLPRVAGTPTLASFDGALVQPMIDIVAQWPNSGVKNADAGPNYGRDIARQVGDAALALNLDYTSAEKRPLLIRLVQRGIDTYGLARAGMVWFPNGGHNTGRKLPMLIAAKTLHHADMLAWADGQQHFIFQEDMQHWYLSQEDVDLPRASPNLAPYTKAMIGLPEWASNPVTERGQTGSDWGKPYRIVNGVADTPLVLAAKLMGLRTAWNWKPLFDYIEDRFWPVEGLTPSSSQRLSAFERAMWTSYHAVEALDLSEDNVATDVWQNLSIPSQDGTFTVAFDTIASADPIDGIIGLSHDGATSAAEVVAALRFAPSGQFEALNGDSYQAATRLNYDAGVKYRVVARIDLNTQSYSVTVAPPERAPVTIADNWQIRRDGAGALQLNRLSFVSSGGNHAVLDEFVFPD